MKRYNLVSLVITCTFLNIWGTQFANTNILLFCSFIEIREMTNANKSADYLPKRLQYVPVIPKNTTAGLYVYFCYVQRTLCPIFPMSKRLHVQFPLCPKGLYIQLLCCFWPWTFALNIWPQNLTPGLSSQIISRFPSPVFPPGHCENWAKSLLDIGKIGHSVLWT